MIMRNVLHRGAVLALVAALLVARGADAASAAGMCSRKPPAPDTASWLGEDIIINGMPASVLAVSYRDSAAGLAQRYRAHWDEAGVVSRALRNRDGWLITAVEGECSYTLQLAVRPGANGMTSGLFSAMRMHPVDLPAQVNESALPLPQGGKVILDVVSRDPMTIGRTVVVELDGGARRAREQYLAHLRSKGWRVLSDASAPRMSARPAIRGGHAIALQLEGYKLDAAFTPDGSATRVVINLARTL
jgi:hypothetical protein